MLMNSFVRRAAFSGLSRRSARFYSAASAQAESLDSDSLEKYFKAYYDSERAYTNIDLDDINFECGSDRRNNPVPRLNYKGANEITVLAPWASVIFAQTGYKGNLGDKIYGSTEVVSDPLAVKQKVVLGLNGLTDEDRESAANEHFKGYLQWIDAIRGKLVDHVVDNLSSYPKLRIKYKQWENRPDMLREMIDGASSKCIKYKKDEQGDNIEESAFAQIEKKMFFKQKEGVDKQPYLSNDFDREVYENQRGVRLSLHHYNIQGEKMDLETTDLKRNDVVSIEVQITSSMYETFFGLKQNLRSITLLHKYKRKPSVNYKAPTSPYGNLASL